MFGVPRLRAETRHRLKEELKRVIQTAHRVRHWEKKWISLPDTNLQVYKWVPLITATDNVVSASPGGSGTSARRTPTQQGARNIRPGSSNAMHSGTASSVTPRASLGVDESSSSQQANVNDISMTDSNNQPTSENNAAANASEGHESFRQR